VAAQHRAGVEPDEARGEPTDGVRLDEAAQRRLHPRPAGAVLAAKHGQIGDDQLVDLRHGRSVLLSRVDDIGGAALRAPNGTARGAGSPRQNALGGA